jgi:ATP-dependent protease ClpP protease subunit
MSKIFVALLAFCFSFQALGETYKIPDRSRVVRVSGEIGRNALDVAEQLQKLSTSKKPVVLVINSPGGSVFAGAFVVAALELLKERKVPTVCVVTTLAASMAFQFLPYCEKRLAFARSLLLFHPMRANLGRGAALTADDARAVATDLDRAELPLKRDLQKMLCLDDRTFEDAYKAERLWTGEELVAESRCNWLTLVDDVEGLGPVIFNDPTARPEGLGGF